VWPGTYFGAHGRNFPSLPGFEPGRGERKGPRRKRAAGAPREGAMGAPRRGWWPSWQPRGPRGPALAPGRGCREPPGRPDDVPGGGAPHVPALPPGAAPSAIAATPSAPWPGRPCLPAGRRAGIPHRPVLPALCRARGGVWAGCPAAQGRYAPSRRPRHHGQGAVPRALRRRERQGVLRAPQGPHARLQGARCRARCRARPRRREEPWQRGRRAAAHEGAQQAGRQGRP